MTTLTQKTAQMIAACLAATALAGAPAAMADGHKSKRMSKSSGKKTSLFDQIDTNDNGKLTRQELMMYHDNAVSAQDAHHFTHVEGASRSDITDYFRRLDSDSDGNLTQKEFSRMDREVRDQFAGPTYYTVSYYTMLNEKEDDYLEGRDVENLNGDSIGTVEEIVRMKSDGDLYALIDLDGAPFYRLVSYSPQLVGVKLDDMLFLSEDDALAMTTKGEDEIRDMDAKEVDRDDYEEVDKLWTMSR